MRKMPKGSTLWGMDMGRHLQYTLMCLGLFLGLLCLFSISAKTAEAALTPPVTGDWTINVTENPSFGSGSIIYVNWTVYINGSLTLDGAQLLMGCPGTGQCGIEVNASGSFKVMRSATVNWGPAVNYYYIWAKTGSNLNVTNSTILRVTKPSFVTGVLYGGVNVDTSSFVFKGNYLNNSIGGLALNASAPTEAIRDNTFYNDDMAVALVNNSDADLVNNLFFMDYTAISASKSFLNVTGGVIANGNNGVQGFNSTIKLVKVTVDANYYNVFLNRGTATLMTCDISTSIGYDYALYNGATIILNDTIYEGASIDMEKVAVNVFSAYWGIDVKVLWDTDSTPVNGSNVTIKDQKSTTYPQYLTNATGHTQTFWILAYVQSSNAGTITKDYYTPHNFSVSYKGLSSWTMLGIYEPQTVTVPLYDTIAPSLNITNPSTSKLAINTTTLNMNGTTSDSERSVTQVLVSIGGYDPNFYPALGTLFWNYTLEFPGDGVWLVTVKAVDLAGNARLATLEVTVDTTPPHVTVMGPSNGTMVNTPEIEVHGFTEIGAVLAVNGDLVNVTNGSGAWSVPVPLSEGDNIITVSAKDALNNTFSFDIFVVLDTLEPEVSVNLYKVGEVNNVDQENVTITGDADPNDIVTINGNPAHRSGASFDASVHLEEGRNTIEIKVTDAVGNVNRTILVFFLDTTPPTVYITWPYPDFVTSKAYIIVTGRAVGATDVTINGKAAEMDGELFSLNVTLSNGGNTITIEAMDELGNTATESFVVIQDNKAPDIAITQPGDNYVTDQGTITVKGTVKGMDISWVRINGKPFQLQGENFTFVMNLSEGTNTFIIEASDNADNTATASRTITLDTGKGKDKKSESKSFFQLLMNPTDPLGMMLWIMIIVIIAMCAAVGSVVAKTPKEAPQPERPPPGRPGGPRPGGPGGPPRSGPYGRGPPPRGGPYGGPGPGPGYGRRGPPPPGYPRRRPPPYGRRGPPPDSGGYPPQQEPTVPSYSVPSTTESYQPGDLGPPATPEVPVEQPPEEVPVFTPAVEEAPIVEPAPVIEAPEAAPEPEPAPEPEALAEPAQETAKPEMEQNIESILQTLGPGEGVTAATAVAAPSPGKSKAIDMEKKVEAKPVLKCPNCGGEVKANWPACPFCDYNLKGGEQKPSKPPEPKKGEPPVEAKAQAAPKKEEEKRPETKKDDKKKGTGGKEDLDNLLAKLKLS